MTAPDRFTCAGCGRVHSEVALAGAFIPQGTAINITYMLCRSCAADFIADQQKILDRVEARLLTAQGVA